MSAHSPPPASSCFLLLLLRPSPSFLLLLLTPLLLPPFATRYVSVSLSQYMCLCACLIWVISIAMFFLFPESFTESLLARHCQKTNLLIFWGSSFLFSITFDIFKLSFVFPYLIFLLRDVRFLMCLCLRPPWGRSLLLLLF